MPKYLTKPTPANLQEVARIGASPGYIQLQNGSVIKFTPERPVERGDFVLMDSGKPLSVLSPQDVAEGFLEIPEDVNPLHVEDNIEAIEYVDAGDTRICVLTLKDGRKITGTDNAIVSTEEERQEMAYHDAFNNLLRHEIFVLQGLHALFKEAK